jgi:hypothetical protein
VRHSHEKEKSDLDGELRSLLEINGELLRALTEGQQTVAGNREGIASSMLSSQSSDKAQKRADLSSVSSQPESTDRNKGDELGPSLLHDLMAADVSDFSDIDWAGEVLGAERQNFLPWHNGHSHTDTQDEVATNEFQQEFQMNFHTGGLFEGSGEPQEKERVVTKAVIRAPSTKQRSGVLCTASLASQRDRRPCKHCGQSKSLLPYNERRQRRKANYSRLRQTRPTVQEACPQGRPTDVKHKSPSLLLQPASPDSCIEEKNTYHLSFAPTTDSNRHSIGRSGERERHVDCSGNFCLSPCLTIGFGTAYGYQNTTARVDDGTNFKGPLVSHLSCSYVDVREAREEGARFNLVAQGNFAKIEQKATRILQEETS